MVPAGIQLNAIIFGMSKISISEKLKVSLVLNSIAVLVICVVSLQLFSFFVGLDAGH